MVVLTVRMARRMARMEFFLEFLAIVEMARRTTPWHAWNFNEMQMLGGM